MKHAQSAIVEASSVCHGTNTSDNRIFLHIWERINIRRIRRVLAVCCLEGYRVSSTVVYSGNLTAARHCRIYISRISTKIRDTVNFRQGVTSTTGGWWHGHTERRVLPQELRDSVRVAGQCTYFNVDSDMHCTSIQSQD